VTSPIKSPLPLRRNAFGVTPRLPGDLVTLVPLGLRHLEEYMLMLADPEVRLMTGSESFPRRTIIEWLTARPQQTDRADWAITSTDTGAFLGEAVLNQFEPANAAANFRIALCGPTSFGKGFGTAATMTAVRHGFSQVGLHRISLEVFDFNARAHRSYVKAGFVQEGVKRDAHHDESGWHDVIVMAVLAAGQQPEPASARHH
jgi:RimJ/RimL family protein N-acetyltransferase